MKILVNYVNQREEHLEMLDNKMLLLLKDRMIEMTSKRDNKDNLMMPMGDL